MRGRLLAATRWFAEAERRLCGAMEQGGGAALQRETLVLAGELESLYSDDPPAAYRQLSGDLRDGGVPRMLLVEYLDGINLALVRQEYRDRIQFRQLARTRLVVPALVGLSLAGMDREDTRRAATRFAEGAAMVSVLEQIGADLERGCVLIPLEDLLRHRVSQATLMERRVDAPLNSLIAAWLHEAGELLSQGAALESLSSVGESVQQARASMVEGINRIQKNPACIYELPAPPPKGLLRRLFPFLGK